MSKILYILLAIIILGIIVMMHEFGHFIVGRKCGIRVKEFSVGFGPKIVSKKGKDTVYSLRVIPLGGYCAFYGEDSDENDSDAFNAQKAWKRFLTVLCGPVMNFLLAFVCTFAYYAAFGVTEYTSVPVVAEVYENMPAEEAGLQAGDIIVSVNGTEIPYDETGTSMMTEEVEASAAIDPDMPVELEIEREGEIVTVSCNLELSEGRYLMGISIGQEGETTRLNLIACMKYSVVYMKEVMVSMVKAIVSMFTSTEVLANSAGAIYIVDTMAEGIREGLDRILALVIIISLNLGIMNLLPLPALDGGRLVFLFVEMVTGKALNRKYEAIIHGVGLLLLFALMIVIGWRDILRLMGRL